MSPHVARHPRQARARARFERVLAEAEHVILATGLGGLSLPTVAERTGYSRGCVYSYFPTPRALLNELVKRYLAEVEASFTKEVPTLERLPWRLAIEHAVTHAVEFHARRPVSQLVLLGGAVSNDSFRAQDVTLRRLGELGRRVLEVQNIVLPAGPPDVAALAVDLGVTAFRRSVMDHGVITRAYHQAAVDAMTSFLEPYAESAAA